jgi:hypothetical protein
MGDFSTLLFKEAEGSEVTEDDYSDIDFDVRTKKAITIRLKNTHAANGLKYRVDSYVNIDGILSKEEVAEATVAAAATVEIILPKVAEFPKKLAVVRLQVKSAIAATPATYVWESIAGRY